MLVLVALILVIEFTYAVSRWTDARSDAALFEVSESPQAKVGLVLGCSRYLSDGSDNLFFKYRMAKAAELYKAGKVDYLLVSGDNSRMDYDEPSEMQDALTVLGVPRERIVPDYAGLSTLDSIVRAKEIFGQTQLVVVSQEFHVRRAVCIGKSHDMQVSGVPAADVPNSVGLPTLLREYLARVKMVLDLYILHRNPKYLGDKVVIGE